MAGEDNIKGTGVLTNKAPEIPTSEPAFDDGSLACLGINTDTRRKMFTCPAKSQTELVGKTFWIVDYFANIEGKDGQEKCGGCGLEKDINEFYYVKNHGYSYLCKECHKEEMRRRNLKYKLNNIGNGKVFK